MSYVERHLVTIETDAGGDGVGYSPVVTGKISQIRYVKDDYANGVDFTITAEATGETIWAEENVNASAVRAPRQATHSTAGAAALYAAGGTAVNAHVVVAESRIKVVVAQGGNALTATLYVTVG